jgi:SAM-dependent methyltransferase
MLNPDVERVVHARESVVLQAIRMLGKPLRECRILDVGCGSGNQLLRFLSYGASPENLAGIDVAPHRIATAKGLLPNVSLEVGSADRLPYPGDSFDLVFGYTLLMAMLDAQMRQDAAGEMLRVCRGLVISYDAQRDSWDGRKAWKANTSPVHYHSKRELLEMFPGATFLNAPPFHYVTVARP